MDPYRLPRTVVPSRYDLRLEPDLDAATFEGCVVITVTVHEPVAEIALNAAELLVSFADFTTGEQTSIASVTLDEGHERCLLRFEQPLPPGEGRLQLRFRGTLNDRLLGFYRSRYRDSAGQERVLAATQFEATDARRAFPCWDEPAFKAVFAVTLVVASGLQALSNTRVVAEEEQDQKRIVRFADSMPMSTYLVAFVVGVLEATEAEMVGPTPVRVWCVPGKTPLARFGLEVGVSSLRFFERYYGLPYPGDKLDLIAIPDFAAGAMENLGAITFRETALLVDEETATHQEKERVADVVAHEIAHMWFGDLVTMRWWNGLWLNEAFATYMQMLAVDAWKPQWHRWTTFSVSRAAALLVDGLHASRPIEFPVQAPHDAEAMFDVLTYEKGASLLHLLAGYLGPEVFRAGVRAYLEKHRYQNTETHDLWHAIGEVAGRPVAEIMEGWIFQSGYPLISASREGSQLVLRQQRFSYLPAPRGEPARRWQVPIRVRIAGATLTESHRVLLEDEEARVYCPPGALQVVVNAQGEGFFRARYSPDLLRPILDRLSMLSAVERFNLVNDAWATVLAGLMPLPEFLDLTTRFRGERDRNIWSVSLGAFTTLSRIIDEGDRPSLQKLVRDRLGPAVAELGWLRRDTEDDLTAQLRGDLLRAIGILGDDAAVQAEAALVFAGGQADASVQAATIAILAHVGDGSRYETFLARFRSARTPQEEQRYLMALAGFRPAALVERTLGCALDGTVKTQDAPLLLRALLLGVSSRERAWEFFRANWDEMARRFPGPGIRRLCEGVLGLTSLRWEQEVQTFFRGKSINLGGKTLDQFLEQLHVVVELRRREGTALRDYLRLTSK